MIDREYQAMLASWLASPSRNGRPSLSRSHRAISAPNGKWVIQRFEGRIENGLRLKASNLAGIKHPKPWMGDTSLPWVTISGPMDKIIAAEKLAHL
jgi:hypothetical protein